MFVWLRIKTDIMYTNNNILAFLFVLFTFEIAHLSKRFHCSILRFIGEYSMNIFLTHSLLITYLPFLFYSFKYPILIFLVTLLASLGVAVVIEMFKKLTHYDRFILFLRNKVS